MSLRKAPKARLIDRSVLAINENAPRSRKPEAWFRSTGHLAWLRTLACACGCGGMGQIEAAHVRVGSDGAAGCKPSDFFALPLTAREHQAQHMTGEVSFCASRGQPYPADFAARSYGLISPCPKTREAAANWLRTGDWRPTDKQESGR